MPEPIDPTKSRPSMWAVALLLGASAFALAALYLLSGEVQPFW